MPVTRKPLHFMGSSHNDLKGFPDEARRDAGFNLDFVQRGFDPEDWKPMKTVGAGVNEIRVRDATGAYRDDIDLAQKRFKAIPKPARK